MATRNILLLTLGSRGDVQPYIALGRALAARGATVTLTTARNFTAMVEENGLNAAPLSIDIEALLQTPEMRQALTTFKGKIAAWRAGKDLIRQQLDEMWRIVRDQDPDVIVYHPKAVATPYMARAIGAIAVPSFLQPGYQPTRCLPPVLIPMPDLGATGNLLANTVTAWLIRLGHRTMLKPWLRENATLASEGTLAPLEGFHPDFHRSSMAVPRLHAFSRHLVPPPPDWQEREQITGAWHGVRTATPLDAPLRAFLAEGPPPVHIGFGSMLGDSPERLTRLVIEAASAADCRAVLTTGWGGLAAIDAPDHVLIIDNAPYDQLFLQCAAVVHHGGAGTTHQALRAGRPSLICPVFGDQPFWGRRIAALGAGPAPMPLARLARSPRAVPMLAAALRQLVDGSYAAEAEKLAAVMADEGGAEQAAELVLALTTANR